MPGAPRHPERSEGARAYQEPALTPRSFGRRGSVRMTMGSGAAEGARTFDGLVVAVLADRGTPNLAYTPSDSPRVRISGMKRLPASAVGALALLVATGSLPAAEPPAADAPPRAARSVHLHYPAPE